MLTLAENVLHDLKPMTDPLAIYLNDHLAGATAGLELFRRATGSAEGEHRQALERLTREVAGDRAAMLDIMAMLQIPVRHYKVAAGWLGEKVGRAKLNGRIVGRSPLSSLIELEALVLGVHGKAACWRTLRVVAEHDDRLSPSQLDELTARAARQSAELEDLRRAVAAEVFGGP
ncbi:MAG: hypothetical protein ACXV4A_15060 [Actinomycetes bacterium]